MTGLTLKVESIVQTHGSQKKKQKIGVWIQVCEICIREVIFLCLYWTVCVGIHLFVYECTCGHLGHSLYNAVTRDVCVWGSRPWSAQALYNKQWQQHTALTLPERQKCGWNVFLCIFSLRPCSERWILLSNLLKLNSFLLCGGKREGISSSRSFCIMLVIWLVSCAL